MSTLVATPAHPAARPSVSAPTPSKAALALQGRGLGFGYSPTATPIFSGIDIDVHQQEIVCLLGASGCGKSTLLRTLAGLQPPTRGQVEFLGKPLTQPHPRAAVVFQQASLLPWLSVRDNVAFGLDFKHQPALQEHILQQRVAQAIEAVGLKGKEALRPAQLSGGMAQRVALARALAREPLLLLADEPFSALDAITRTEMQELLVSVVQRWHTAALLVTHDIDEAILVADRIVLMGTHPPGQADHQGGCIVRQWQVQVPHPRCMQPADVTTLRLEILSALHGLRTEQQPDRC